MLLTTRHFTVSSSIQLPGCTCSSSFPFPLFHWAHRFRYTVYDLFQVQHGTQLIALLCYGAAFGGTLVAAYTLWTFS